MSLLLLFGGGAGTPGAKVDSDSVSFTEGAVDRDITYTDSVTFTESTEELGFFATDTITVTETLELLTVVLTSTDAVTLTDSAVLAAIPSSGFAGKLPVYTGNRDHTDSDTFYAYDNAGLYYPGIIHQRVTTTNRPDIRPDGKLAVTPKWNQITNNTANTTVEPTDSTVFPNQVEYNE